jgi:nucleotide-binding universal stress UspA family protein
MFEIRTLLVPVDFSERSMAAAEHAAAIAKQFDARLLFLHVIPRHPLSAADAELRSGAPPPEEFEAVRKQMTLLEANVCTRPVDTVVLWGDPARCIEQVVWEHHVDLVVMPTHGYGPFRRFLLGSVTAKVLHDLNCPVFSGIHVPEIGTFSSLPYKRVLCAIDVNDYAETVLQWACGFAQIWGASFSVIHAAKCLELDATQRELMRAERLAIGRLLAAVGCTAEVHIDVANAIEYVPAVAKKTNGDVLVIGRSVGEEWMGRLRATAYALIRESPCPVISV